MKSIKTILLIISAITIISSFFAYKVQVRFTGIYACYTTCQPGAKFLGKLYTTTDNGFVLCCTIPRVGAQYIPKTVTFVGL